MKFKGNSGDSKKVLREKVLPINPFKRLAKQCGIKRISGKACRLLTQYCEEYTIQIIKKADMLSKHANRTTVLDRDIEKAKTEVNRLNIY